MVGITAYGAYIPLFRLSRDAIAQAWGRGSLGGERSVANNDEDSATMAIEAAFDCLQGVDRQGVDGLFLASTSSPYQEKQCSTLVAAVADLVRHLMSAAPGLRILVTSRKPLGTSDERILNLSPLSTPSPSASIEALEASAAVQLLRERLATAGGPAVRTADLPLLAQVCQRVDGLPLAIELAAVTVAREGLAATSDGLLDQLFGAEDQSPLASAITRGLDILDDSARHAFYGCSVFPSWFGDSEFAAVTEP